LISRQESLDYQVNKVGGRKMPNQVIMPQLGESVDEGTVTRWLKNPGDKVEEYEPLLEVNTDKVDSEIPSPFEGTLLEIVVPEGTTVKAGELLAWIGEEGESAPGDGETGEKQAAGQVAPEQASETEPVQLGDTTVPVQVGEEPAREPGIVEEAAPDGQGERGLGFISPVVGKIASEHNIDLTKVEGTGLGGRITKKDVLAYVEQVKEGAKPAPAEAKPAAAPAKEIKAPPAADSRPAPKPIPAGPEMEPGEILPLTPVRRSIADHMVFSKHTSPHVTTVMEADLSKVARHREANKAAFEKDGVNLTFTAYFISAISAALKAYPIVNSSWSEEGIQLHRQINIGMAASLGEGGLIVPVIKNADSLSLLGLARSINDLAERARSRKLQPDEVKGGTFTITNHGTSGSLFATPIINQPQCGILGVGMIQKRVVVIDDAIAIRPMVYISLTFDHRILDGAIADNFLSTVVKSLENWG
jgi:2-oxoglutarate dehydrogenase dihydrolipoamide succinyltransferase (E2 component)